eukprot:TRINITY_DN280_c0_g2_i1.p1 TRINITY_DN280_c0_g2~~TRINITY_DN280_c0_g2_i1.p1  ORF type:complete len:325 (-),score=107.20 TRINITY_DN280_c0_g2_i1:94-1068(-)
MSDQQQHEQKVENKQDTEHKDAKTDTKPQEVQSQDTKPESKDDKKQEGHDQDTKPESKDDKKQEGHDQDTKPESKDDKKQEGHDQDTKPESKDDKKQEGHDQDKKPAESQQQDKEQHDQKGSEAKVEDAKDANNDEPPPLEEVDSSKPPTEDVAKGPKAKQSRSEKKSRKAVQKLGLKPVTGITHVTITRKDDVFVISDPDVYKSPGEKSSTYIIFGVASTKNLANSAAAANAASAAAQFKVPEEEKPSETAKHAEETTAPQATPVTGPVEVKKEPDTAVSIEPSQIDLIVEQTGATKEQAEEALRKAGGHVVDAIMNLTTSQK